jgi:hypothetical protein
MTDAPVPARIWLALDAPGRNEGPLEAAVGLARELHGEVAAVFVENVDLIRLAGFPGAAETRLFGREAVPLALDELEAALRAQALLIERMLGRVARQAGVSWSFQRTRGRIVHLALELAASAECIVLPPASCSVSMGPYAGAGSRAVASRSPSLRVWAMPGEGPGAVRVLEMGHRLLRLARAPGRLVMPATAVGAESVRSWLARQGQEGEWLEATGTELATMGRAGSPTEHRLLILPKPADPQAIGRLEAAFRRIGWTLLMV